MASLHRLVGPVPDDVHSENELLISNLPHAAIRAFELQARFGGALVGVGMGGYAALDLDFGFVAVAVVAAAGLAAALDGIWAFSIPLAEKRRLGARVAACL